jgi:hypothetical protein
VYIACSNEVRFTLELTGVIIPALSTPGRPGEDKILLQDKLLQFGLQ